MENELLALDDRGKLNKVVTDMYFGDGPQNPSITTRLAMLEDSAKRDANFRRWSLSLLALILGTVIATLISNHIH